MKVSAVFTNKLNYSGKKDQVERYLFYNFILLGAGIIIECTVFMLNKKELSLQSDDIFINYFAGINASDEKNMFLIFLVSHLIFYVFSLIFATSTLGCYLISVFGIYKTMGLGLFISYLYSGFGLKGIEFALLVILPGKFLLILSMLLTMCLCEKNSIKISSLQKGEKYQKASTENLLKLIMISVLYLLSVVIDYFTARNFGALFDFI